MSPSSPQQDPDTPASFVFTGTVKKLKAATMTSVPITKQTAVVHVDQVQQAPKILSRYEGHDITVQLRERSDLKAGMQAIFYTNEWLFGDGVAVQEQRHTEVGQSAAAPASKSGSAPGREAQALRQHLEDADIVVSGKVISVGLPKETGAKGARAGSGTASLTGRVSEHSPLWNEALVEVQTVEKGRESHKQIVVRFPRSSDVAWAKAPKFEPGQQGLFVLHRASEEGASSRRGGGKSKQGPQSYVALHAHDFLPTHKTEQVRSLIPTSGRKPSAG
jgi:hypothetical protein